jgi:hypothetical protein
MFFNPNQVNNLLSCKSCSQRLDEPRLLPCGKNICSNCYLSIQTNNNEFQCIICKDKHLISNKNGLPINETVLEMLSFKSVNISRGKAFDSLQATLNFLLNKRDILKHQLENRGDLIKEHCIVLRNQVQLLTEELIQQINKLITMIVLLLYKKRLSPTKRINNSLYFHKKKPKKKSKHKN